MSPGRVVLHILSAEDDGDSNGNGANIVDDGDRDDVSTSTSEDIEGNFFVLGCRTLTTIMITVCGTYQCYCTLFGCI